jgi:small GTP-binding protein
MSEKLSFKISVMGDSGVGKSSILRRYVLGEFTGVDLATIGMASLKKEIPIRSSKAGREVTLTLNFVDIMGSHSLRELLQRAYFYGTHGVLAICDVTRPETLTGLPEWVEILERTTGKVPMVILANKADLSTEARVDKQRIDQVAAQFNCPAFMTSAKTGENIEEAMKTLLTAIIKKAQEQERKEEAEAAAE